MVRWHSWFSANTQRWLRNICAGSSAVGSMIAKHPVDHGVTLAKAASVLSLTSQGMDVVPAEVWRVGPSWWGFTPMTFSMSAGVSSLGLDFPSMFTFCGSGDRCIGGTLALVWSFIRC